MTDDSIDAEAQDSVLRALRLVQAHVSAHTGGPTNYLEATHLLNLEVAEVNNVATLLGAVVQTAAALTLMTSMLSQQSPAPMSADDVLNRVREIVLQQGT